MKFYLAILPLICFLHEIICEAQQTPQPQPAISTPSHSFQRVALKSAPLAVADSDEPAASQPVPPAVSQTLPAAVPQPIPGSESPSSQLGYPTIILSKIPPIAPPHPLPLNSNSHSPVHAQSDPATPSNCPLICPSLNAPICTSNGKENKTFDNACKLDAHNCQHDPKERFVFQSPGYCN